MRRTWLDLADPGPRRLLVGLTLLSLTIGTLLLDRLHLTVAQVDLISLAWLGSLALLWGLLRWRTEPRVRARRVGDRARRQESLRQRGFLVGGAIDDGRGGVEALAVRDPSFSEPALADWVRRLLAAHWADDSRAGAWVRGTVEATAQHLVDARCSAVTVRPDSVRCEWSLHGPLRDGSGSQSIRVLLERPAAARSLPPDELTHLDRAPTSSDWYLLRAETAPEEALPLPSQDEGLDAAVRSLCGQDPSFRPQALRARGAAVVRALAFPDELRALCTPAMADAAGAIADAFSDAPSEPTAEQVHLVSVASDGWHDLAELTCGRLALAFLRPTGEADAPWLLWRAWRGAVP